jgi:hypothetical protein
MESNAASRALRVGVLIAAVGLVAAMLLGCSMDPEAAFEFRVTHAVSAAGYDKYVKATGFVEGDHSAFIILRSTTAELGGLAQANVLAKKIATAVFASVPDLKKVSVMDTNDADIGTYESPPGK